MILFFNFDTIKKESKNDPVKMVALLKKYYENKILSKGYFLHKNLTKFKGSSFLLNPDPLFKSKVDVLYKIQYITLAAKRDFFLYKLYKEKALLLSYFPDLCVDKIKHNPLLTITTEKILFKYEEIYG